MPDRKPMVAANWKMQKTVGETTAFLERFASDAERLGGADLVVCPPFTALAAAVEATRSSAIRIAAQNVHEAEGGAFTGEISIPMLTDLGVDGAILGHSERRTLFCESDEALARKLPAVAGAGLLAILCVGESEEERDADRTDEVLRRQLEADLANLDDGALAEIVIAYEPIWAIGTGRTASPEQAQEACGFIRSLLADRSSDAGARVRILYGGSVKPANAAELFAQPDIDGGLVGGASLEVDDFTAICEAAAAG